MRLDLGDGPGYGQLAGDLVQLLRDDPVVTGRTDPTGRTVPLTDSRLLPPVRPSKVVAVGRNYLDHVREMGYDIPEEPNLFLKPPSSVTGPDTSVILPPCELSELVEHEAELAIVIGREARHLEPSDALDHVFGFTCANDVSARDLQRRDPSITRAKGFDTFCPLGPWIETELDLDHGVAIRSRVNGKLRQDGTTRDLIFDVPTLLSYTSQVMTLHPGDVVLTGSPGGSGPMVDGDLVEIEIEGIGVLRHGVEASTSAAD